MIYSRAVVVRSRIMRVRMRTNDDPADNPTLGICDWHVNNVVVRYYSTDGRGVPREPEVNTSRWPWMLGFSESTYLESTGHKGEGR